MASRVGYRTFPYIRTIVVTTCSRFGLPCDLVDGSAGKEECLVIGSLKR